MIRIKVSGTAKRPRLSVFRSNKHIYAQVIDDEKGRTIVGISDPAAKDAKKQNKSIRARALGKLLAQRAKEAKVKKVVFDRGGYNYHGRLKSLADGAREGGLEF